MRPHRCFFTHDLIIFTPFVYVDKHSVQLMLPSFHYWGSWLQSQRVMVEILCHQVNNLFSLKPISACFLYQIIGYSAFPCSSSCVFIFQGKFGEHICKWKNNFPALSSHWKRFWQAWYLLLCGLFCPTFTLSNFLAVILFMQRNASLHI